ncbi:MAG TPA: hypothetical protein VJ839_02985 [Candidatus Limnocylindria bacterium]|nr:hypothetical protein [Candidatus Limnocylindria bacterium]
MAVAVVVLVGVGSLLRPPVVAPPTGPGSPTASPSVVCEAFVEGGPMDNIGTGYQLSGQLDDIYLGKLDDSVTGLLALAERASGDERDDLLAVATAVDDWVMVLREVAKYSPEEFQNLPQDAQDAFQEAGEAWNAFNQDAHPAFYLKYTERCDVELDAPRTVECGPLDQVTCDRRVADLIAGYRQAWADGFYDAGLPPGLPVLYVMFDGPVSPSGCISYEEISWPGGGRVAQNECGDSEGMPTPTAVVGSPEVGVPHQVIVHCTVDFRLGDTWWRFDSAGPTPGPIVSDLRGSVPAIVTLTSPDTAILRVVDGTELMLSRVDEPIEGSCVGV